MKQNTRRGEESREKRKGKVIKEMICEKENERKEKERSSLYVGFIHSAAWIQSSQVT